MSSLPTPKNRTTTTTTVATAMDRLENARTVTAMLPASEPAPAILAG